MQKTFITTKIVNVNSMQALQAELAGYRTNNIPSETAGYEVTYEDGYKSWCPKDVFDKNAVELKDLSLFTAECKDTMPDFLKRMFEEHNELRNRLSKLLEFLNSDKFITLNKKQQEDLHKQYIFMLGYLNVLRERIIYEISVPVE